MSQREQIKKPQPQDKVNEAEARRMAEEDAEVQAAQESEGADLSDIDDLLDEIDALLEENAQDFVASYIQKGGQ